MESTLRSQNISAITSEFKKTYDLSQECPVCNKKIRFGVELGFLESVKRFPYPHIILHGNPIHALVVYIDADFRVRSIETVRSIEIQRDSDTFSQIVKKWSNPF